MDSGARARKTARFGFSWPWFKAPTAATSLLPAEQIWRTSKRHAENGGGDWQFLAARHSEASAIARLTRKSEADTILRRFARLGRGQRCRPDGLGSPAARLGPAHLHRPARPRGHRADRLQQGAASRGACQGRKSALGIRGCGRRARPAAAEIESRNRHGRGRGAGHAPAHVEQREDAAISRSKTK